MVLLLIDHSGTPSSTVFIVLPQSPGYFVQSVIQKNQSSENQYSLTLVKLDVLEPSPVT